MMGKNKYTKKKRPIGKVKKMLIAFNLTALLILGIWYLRGFIIRSPFFYCKDVMVSGNALIKTESILENIVFDTHKSIFLYDLRSTQQKIDRLPYVKRCVVKRTIPSAIAIEISERKPIAFIQLSHVFLIDDEMVLLPLPEKKIELDYPVLTGIKVQNEEIGKKLESDELTTALALIDSINKINSVLLNRISEVKFSGTGDIIIFTEKPHYSIYLRFSFEDDHLRKWNILEIFKAHNLASIEYLDLRFKNQIVVKYRS